MAKHQIVVPRAGIADGTQKVRAIHSTAVASMLGVLGQTEMRRASHVEPGTELSATALDWLWANAVIEMTREAITGDLFVVRGTSTRITDKWWADLLPVDGPVLGPFDTNTAALEAEVVWLKEHNIPICGPCRDAAVAEIESKPNEHRDD